MIQAEESCRNLWVLCNEGFFHTCLCTFSWLCNLWSNPKLCCVLHQPKCI